MEKTIVNGKEIEHLDVIHHSTTGRLDFWSRIKMLFGKQVTFSVVIYTMHEHCIVVGAVPNAWVGPLIKPKNKGMVQCGEYPLNTEEV
jgi:uncharacterized membrane protein